MRTPCAHCKCVVLALEPSPRFELFAISAITAITAVSAAAAAGGGGGGGLLLLQQYGCVSRESIMRAHQL